MMGLRKIALCALAGAIALSGCSAGTQNTRIDLQPPAESTTLGPGDIFQLEIVGEKDLPTEYQVAGDGTVMLPYIQTLRVVGLEPQEVARQVSDRLMAEKILTKPSVVVSVKEYRSKRVTLLGQVQKPGSFSYTADMTLLQAISLAGGLTAIAQTTRVNLTRTNKKGEKTVVVNVDAIQEGRSADIPLQAGDRVYVQERVF
jgi:polysaccharide export outer membrane protein